MFGMSLPEIIIIAVVAVVFLGPDKLPDAMVKIAKFFKTFKQTVNSAKSTFEQEVKIAELKEDAKKYKQSIQNEANAVRKKLTFEELDELKSSINKTKDNLNESLENIKNDIKNPINSLNSEDILKDEPPLPQATPNLENKKEA